MAICIVGALFYWTAEEKEKEKEKKKEKPAKLKASDIYSDDDESSSSSSSDEEDGKKGSVVRLWFRLRFC